MNWQGFVQGLIMGFLEDEEIAQTLFIEPIITYLTQIPIPTVVKVFDQDIPVDELMQKIQKYLQQFQEILAKVTPQQKATIKDMAYKYLTVPNVLTYLAQRADSEPDERVKQKLILLYATIINHRNGIPYVSKLITYIRQNLDYFLGE